jgi:predicted nucleic acid-binding protein
VKPRGAFLPDTSCLIAAVCAWHEHHKATTAELDRRLARRERMVVVAPALVEAFAVLTRLPPPHRLSGPDALAVLDANFIRGVSVIALRPPEYVSVLRQVVAAGTAGGRTYDAVIAECASVARAGTVLTWNVKDFEAIAGDSVEVVAPPLA